MGKVIPHTNEFLTHDTGLKNSVNFKKAGSNHNDKEKKF
jgi:hypothetical protein